MMNMDYLLLLAKISVNLDVITPPRFHVMAGGLQYKRETPRRPTKIVHDRVYDRTDIFRSLRRPYDRPRPSAISSALDDYL